jgi:hypothetical protein
MTEAAPSARSAAADAAMQATPNLSRTAWSHPEGMDYPEWIAAGRRLGVVGRGSQWWIGDWLLFGTAKFGEGYVEASRVTGYDPKSLRNMRYVASRFPVSLRRDNLQWSHHALLAALESEEQATWLDRAVADRLSVADLRSEMRTAMRSEYAPAETAEHPATEEALVATEEASLEVTAVVVCPNCGANVPLEDDEDEAA